MESSAVARKMRTPALASNPQCQSGGEKEIPPEGPQRRPVTEETPSGIVPILLWGMRLSRKKAITDLQCDINRPSSTRRPRSPAPFDIVGRNCDAPAGATAGPWVPTVPCVLGSARPSWAVRPRRARRARSFSGRRSSACGSRVEFEGLFVAAAPVYLSDLRSSAISGRRIVIFSQKTSLSVAGRVRTKKSYRCRFEPSRKEKSGRR